jgi:alkanesulfonate monooxygenase SsuD/methylene tetrahydromethanopterin reductase-like flavin-dependent oxidoreductase (luciferase family)
LSALANTRSEPWLSETKSDHEIRRFRNPRGAWWKPYPKLLRECLDQIVAVERMGYDNVWVTEHHFVEDDASMAEGIALVDRL